MGRKTGHVLTGGLWLAGLVALSGCQGWREGLTRDERCAPVSAEIYFEPNSAELGPEAQGLIAAAAERAAGCQIDGVDLLGLADATGASDVNLALSEARAAQVAQALTQAGLPEGVLVTQAAGDLDAVRSDGVERPMRRRVDIRFRLSAAR